MENENITMNLVIKQMLQSDVMAYNKEYVASANDSDFGLFNNAYKDKLEKLYAKLN